MSGAVRKRSQTRLGFGEWCRARGLALTFTQHDKECRALEAPAEVPAPHTVGNGACT